MDSVQGVFPAESHMVNSQTLVTHSLTSHNPEEEHDMALSDQLSSLAARAKVAEDHAAAAKQKAKGDLQQDVEAAHQSAAAQGDKLRQKAEDTKDKASASWDNVQRSWNDHLTAMRSDRDDRKAEHDLKSAQRAADRAEEDAEWAINYAYAAIDEADYTVLNAILARRDADARANA